jgi:hypothetical protein
MIRFFEAVESRPENVGRETELQEALRILNRSTEAICLPEASDWRTAIIEGAKNHRRKKMLEHLPAVFDNYLFRLSNGIAFDGQHDEVIYQEYLDHALSYRERVREGKMFLANED